jgi:hypothetical protein
MKISSETTIYDMQFGFTIWIRKHFKAFHTTTLCVILMHAEIASNRRKTIFVMRTQPEDKYLSLASNATEKTALL